MIKNKPPMNKPPMNKPPMNKPLMNKLKYTAAVLIAIAGFGLQQANAFTSFINVGNDALLNNGNTGPYARVDISLVDSNTATVTFTSLQQSGNIYLMGGVHAIALNMNAATFSLSSLVLGSNSGIGFTPGPYTFTGAGVLGGGFGTMNFTIRSFDGFGHSADLITFNVDNTSGTWASADDVLAFNAQGFDAGAHIFPTTFPANGSNSALQTGFAAEAGAGHVPDGGTTVMLLGAALGSLGMARRFLKK